MSQTIILQSLSMINFKGEQKRTTEFNADVTTICGANGLGKSRHMDAFLWLLFGKDAQDRQDYEVKTIFNGEPLHKVDCMVQAKLIVDGDELSLTRKLVEDWVKPKGQVEQVFKGNKTECLWNDAPVTITEYKKRIASIMDDTMFKMLTNPIYFVSQKWQLQREHLFRIAGTMTEQEIANAHPEFADISDILAKKSLSDYKAEVAASIKLAKKELEEIHPRIDQAYKDMPEAEDYDSIQKEIDTLDKDIAEVDNKISAITSLALADAEKVEEMNTIHLKMANIEADYLNEYMARQNELNKTRLELVGEIGTLQNEQKSISADIERLTTSKSNAECSLYDINEKLKAKRDEWKECNSQSISVNENCPVCGNRLPDEQINNAKIKWAEEHNRIVARIIKEGEDLKAEADKTSANIKDTEEQITSLVSKKKDVDSRLAEKQKALANTPAYSEKHDKTKAPGWKELNDKFNALRDELNATKQTIDTADQEATKKELMYKRDALVKRLSKRDEIDRIKQSIQSLEERGVELGETIANLEEIQYHVAQFTKTIIADAEQRINSMFSMVTFKLFDYTIEGNEYECCVPLIDGVPYGSANTASKINAGLDIINTLCRFYKVNAPIFIDNRECVNTLIPTDSQIINLVVTDDKELIVK